MGKKRARWARPNAETRVHNFQSPDDEARGDAVRGFCPCHAGWEVFESHVSDVLRMLRDRSRGVRAQALHVFDDAARMQMQEELKYYLEPGEEKIGEKRAQRFRSIAERLEARRNNQIRKSKRRYGH